MGIEVIPQTHEITCDACSNQVTNDKACPPYGWATMTISTMAYGQPQCTQESILCVACKEYTETMLSNLMLDIALGVAS